MAVEEAQQEQRQEKLMVDTLVVQMNYCCDVIAAALQHEVPNNFA